MKTTLLTLCTTLMFCVLAAAQQPGAPADRVIAQPPPLPPFSRAVQPVFENYVVTLTMTDKEQKESELSLVVASADFKTDFPDAQSNIRTFVGTLTPEDGDAVSIRYALGGQIAVSDSHSNVEYKTVTTQATVRLKLGEPVQILKSDARTCTLSVSRLSGHPAKDK